MKNIRNILAQFKSIEITAKISIIATGIFISYRHICYFL